MASSLGDMVVNLKANTAQFSKKIVSAGGDVKNFAKKAKGSFAGLAGAANPIGLAIAAVATVVAIAGAAINAFVGKIKELDQVAHQIKRTGLGAEELAGFTLAAEMGGSSAAVASKAIDKFTRNMGTAGDETSKTAKTFKMMGVDSQKLATLTPNQQLRETVKAISALPTAALRAHAAFSLFGKGSASLVEVLSGGTGELDAFNDQADAMGLALSGDQLQAVEDVDDAMTMLGMSFSGAAGQITAELSPAFLSFIELLTDFATEAAVTSKWMGQLFNVGGKHTGLTREEALAKRDAIVASGKFPGGSRSSEYGNDSAGAGDLGTTPDEIMRIIKETEKFTDAIKQAKIEGDILSGKMTEIDATIQKFAEAGVDPSILGQLRIQLQINKAIELGNKARKDADRDADRALKKRKRDNDRIAKDNERKTKGKEDFFFNESLQKARDTVNKLKEKANKSPGFAGIAGRGSSEALEIIKRSRGPGKELLKEQKIANATLKSLLAEARSRKLEQFDLQAPI
jgi:hypothetical protein